MEIVYHENKDDQAQQHKQLLAFVRYPSEDLRQFSQVHADPLLQPLLNGLREVETEIVFPDFWGQLNWYLKVALQLWCNENLLHEFGGLLQLCCELLIERLLIFQLFDDIQSVTLKLFVGCIQVKHRASRLLVECHERFRGGSRRRLFQNTLVFVPQIGNLGL